MLREDLFDLLPYGVLNAGLSLKGWIDFHKAVIYRLLVFVEQYLNDAKTFVNRVEQGAVALLVLSSSLLGLLTLSDIPHNKQHSQLFAPLNAPRLQGEAPLRAI